MGVATTHRLETLRKLGDRAFWCSDCDKQWGPYDRVDESEACAARVGREAEASQEAAPLAETTRLRS